MNGLLFILKKFTVAHVWSNTEDPTTPAYAGLRRIIAERGLAFRVATGGEPPTLLDKAEMRVLHPAPAFRPTGKRPTPLTTAGPSWCWCVFRGKNSSLPETSMQMPKHCSRAKKGLACDVLKVPHHGSRSSSTGAFVSAVRPQAAIISVGKGEPVPSPVGGRHCTV